MTIATGEQATAADVLAQKVTTQTDITGSRAIDGTVYQNTGAKAIYVFVSVVCGVASATYAYVTAHSDSATPPTTKVGKTGFTGASTSGSPTGSFMLSFIVLPSNYYKVTLTNTGAGGTLDTWIEYT